MPKNKTKPCARKAISKIGIIIPVVWDVHGNPTRVALSANDENIFPIDKRSEKGRQLGDLIRKWVCVEGVLTPKGAIIVNRYECIDYERFEAITSGSVNMTKVNLNPEED